MLSVLRARLALVVGIAVLLFTAGLSSWATLRLSMPKLPNATATESVVRPLPNVLLAVQDLARLESVAFHMERVIDLTETQSRLFGLVESHDAILLVAVADVNAGIDLGKVVAQDVSVDPKSHTVHIHLPTAEIFHVVFDPEHTYVHTRNTDFLARRKENLEARARSEAERALVDAALEAGILRRASENAQRVVERLIRSLGYDNLEVTMEIADRSNLAPRPLRVASGGGASP